MRVYSGTETVEGKRYDVVPGGSPCTWTRVTKLYFRSDGIPVGIELKEVGGEKRAVTAWLKDPRLDVPLKTAAFAYRPPEGYTSLYCP